MNKIKKIKSVVLFVEYGLIISEFVLLHAGDSLADILITQTV
jgi:hypothetical protein